MGYICNVVGYFQILIKCVGFVLSFSLCTPLMLSGTSLLAQLLDTKPHSTDLLEGVLISDVIHHYGTLAVAVVDGPQGVVPLLSRCVL